jgi:two-component system, chemotaxis family, protein-glutamate methylesterase/glutaminase
MDRLGVFIVEDSSVCAAAIRLAISRDPQASVIGTATNAAEALELCQNLRPDVMTLDLNMPGGGGMEMLTYVKGHCQLPVVIVSASTYEGSPVTSEALALGADACFDKRHLLTHSAEFLTMLRLAARDGDPAEPHH